MRSYQITGMKSPGDSNYLLPEYAGVVSLITPVCEPTCSSFRTCLLCSHTGEKAGALQLLQVPMLQRSTKAG